MIISPEFSLGRTEVNLQNRTAIIVEMIIITSRYSSKGRERRVVLIATIKAIKIKFLGLLRNVRNVKEIVFLITVNFCG